jgi:dipeptidyl aminopeptidase/acylaminoacyl peptidase
MGIFGYSRGAMAASLLSTRLTSKELHAAIFAAGIYDFKKAYDEVTLAGIKENMEKEAGLKEEATKARSSVYRMDKLPCPVLILHGEIDVNAPINQAYLLRDKLVALKKEHELKTFPDKDHDIGRQNLNDNLVSFLNKHLKTTARK